ncbi:protein-tyrosine phosphatase [Caldicoprobacter guelmensis]|uniref:tyrosine-protein phosphatase n=1 Tax=Caldicoprobacter guelmensis TaxID=1170224 RepID=UPI0019586BBA|nr:CpsB/CapC family capsule biosynthesis tyrosine phosphatase [Caldicoprobacter guelmensis]MBM7581708.1 protein-tyrosine phosphatase [Caldicoprobacter guelmensis]
MLDLHCHILPEVDDGAGSIGEALAMAAVAVKEGIDAVVATPHCLDPKNVDAFVRGVECQRQQLQNVLDAQQMDLDIFLGAEVFMDPAFLKVGGLERLTINATSYILVELPMGEVPLYAEDFIYRLRLKGFIPIIAHPERNLAIIRDPNVLYRLVDLGCLCQINTGSITGFFGKQVKRCARILLTHGMGHVLGTDAHSDGTRGPYMKKAVEELKSWLDGEQVRRIVGITPYHILQGKMVATEPPRRYKPRMRIFGF